VTLEDVDVEAVDLEDVDVVAAAASACAAVPRPANTRAAVATAAEPMRRHLPRMAGLVGGVVRNCVLLTRV
jgi:hypothetical protein